jgi:hypothetical protein
MTTDNPSIEAPETSAASPAKGRKSEYPQTTTPAPTFTQPTMSLKEYCLGKPMEVIFGMAALCGDPRYVTKTRREWQAMEQEFKGRRV